MNKGRIPSVVTFDIFDTLIARRCYRPHGVFEIMERRLGIETVLGCRVGCVLGGLRLGGAAGQSPAGLAPDDPAAREFATAGVSAIRAAQALYWPRLRRVADVEGGRAGGHAKTPRR